MSDSKLDYVGVPTTTGQIRPLAQPRGATLSADTKLELPGTLQEFAGKSARALGIKPYRERDTRQAIVDAAGNATLDFGAPSIGYHWMIERAVVFGSGVARVFVGSFDITGLVDLTNTGIDVADENSPIYVASGDRLWITFQSAAVGTQVTANTQVHVIPNEQ